MEEEKVVHGLRMDGHMHINRDDLQGTSWGIGTADMEVEQASQARTAATGDTSHLLSEALGDFSVGSNFCWTGS